MLFDVRVSSACGRTCKPLMRGVMWQVFRSSAYTYSSAKQTAKLSASVSQSVANSTLAEIVTSLESPDV